MTVKQIPGYPGYEVSADGGRDKDGYVKIQLWRDGKLKTFPMHVLVLMTFVGLRPPGHFGCHRNGDTSDNTLDNLRWDTPSGNQRDRLAHGTACLGERHGCAKLSESDVLGIRRRHDGGCELKSIAQDYGVSYTTAWQIARRKTWTHL